MYIDTHCHLDASEFNDDRSAVIASAQQAQVGQIVIPAIGRSNFSTVRQLAHSFDGGYYALGIHPLFVGQAADEDLDILAQEVERALDDPRFVAIGEIGLDFFVKDIATGPPRKRQEFFYQEQLKLARQHALPVLLHVRRSQDIILKYLRRFPEVGGIAHAFNGSDQQADQFVDLGFALGIGGAMTFTRARQIRRLACRIPLSSIVLETDSPDIAPAWLQEDHPRNTPGQIPAIAQALAQLRDVPTGEIERGTNATAHRVLSRLAA
ncbi:DNAase [Advenella sp. S44]|uniref:TatD family hydrolase n=1 Tax=Advenella sp. S44 TaxID=1982755 RepID=UPI000C299A61|nr:TatD family hydrolase [Advenella sp. S44]PJX26452.1 DNAase [Advenella sp. S44]